mmetsp:Transcript_14006/g.42180  ORF Transcript_14006/g.42180 Transcript_14006/m.42180 type:complete len:100 (-) Transcript_14006:2166-2465(-)
MTLKHPMRLIHSMKSKAPSLTNPNPSPQPSQKIWRTRPRYPTPVPRVATRSTTVSVCRSHVQEAIQRQKAALGVVDPTAPDLTSISTSTASSSSSSSCR